MNALQFFSDSVLELLVLVSVNAALLAILVAVVLLSFSRWLAPKHRHWLWLLVAIRLMLPFSAESSFSVFNLIDNAGVQTEQLAEQTPAVSTQHVAYSNLAPQYEAVPDTRDLQAIRPISPSASILEDLNFEVCLFVTWLCGVVLVTLWTIANTIGAIIRFRQAARIDDLRLQTILDDCRRQMSVKRNVQLLLDTKACSPAIAGLWRPKLLVSADLVCEFSEEQLRLIFLHELAHLKRGDVLVNWLLAGIRILHWFNPLFWFVAGRIGANREMACDALALECAGVDFQRAYGETLLRVAERSLFVTRFNAADVTVLALFSRKGLLKRRIMMLPYLAKSRGVAVRAFAAVLVVAAAIAGLTDRISKGTDDPSSAVPSPQSERDQAPTVTTTNSAPVPEGAVAQKVYDLTRVREHFNKLPVPANQSPDEYFMQLLWGKMPKSSPDEIVLLSGNQLTVKAKQTFHDSVQSLLKVWEVNGMFSLGMTVRIISSDKDLAEEANVTWSRLEAPQISPSKVPRSLFAEQTETLRTPVAEFVSARSYSVLSENLKADPKKRFCDLAQAGVRSNILSAPKVTAMSGQTADIVDVVSRPFVVAIRDSGKGYDQPEIRVVEEGTRIQIRGSIRDVNGPVGLDCLVQLNSIDEVKTTSFRLGKAKDNVKVQVPSVKTERFHINTEVPLGESLLISPLRTDDEKKWLYILIDTELASPPVVRKT